MDVQVTATVEVAEGRLKGRQANGIESFLGVPFVAPPVGDLRFRAPRPAAPWAPPVFCSPRGASAPFLRR